MHTNLSAKNCKLHNLQLPILISKKSIILDIHHRIPCMYINFQQNRVSRSVRTVNTKLFANNHKLHKFATCNSNFKTKLVSDMHNPDVNI